MWYPAAAQQGPEADTKKPLAYSLWSDLAAGWAAPAGTADPFQGSLAPKSVYRSGNDLHDASVGPW